jgi:PAS domain S-box-containing protein
MRATHSRDKLAAARQQQALAETFNQIIISLGSSLNYESVLDRIIEYLGQVAPHDAACLLLVEGDVARAFRWHGYAGFNQDDPFTRRTLSIAHTPALQLIQETGQPLFIPHVTTDIYGFNLPWLKSHLGVPILIRRQLHGFLNVDSATPNFFGQAEVERLQAFVEAAAVALNNAQLYNHARQEINERVKALKKERNFASAVLDTAGALVMVLNPQGRILRFNRACEQTTGYTLAEVQGKRFWDLFVTTDQLAAVKAIFARLQHGQRGNEYESYWYAKDRSKRLMAWSNTVLLDPHGEVEYIISSGLDITERRQLRDHLVAIHHMGRELNLLQNPDSILEMALETAAFLLEFKSAGYGLVDETSGDLKYCYHPVRGIPKSVALNVPLDVPRRLDALMVHCERFSNLNPADTLPIVISPVLARRCWLSVPLTIGERIIGVFDIEGHEPDQFTPNDRQLLQTLADQTAVAIENAQLHQEARQRVDELSTLNVISQAMTSTLNLEETLTIITDYSLRLLEAAAASVVLLDEIRGDLWFNTTSGGQASALVRGKRLAVGQGIVGWVIQNGEPTLVADTTKDERFFGDFDQQTGFSTHSIICVPLQTRDETIGAIEVINKKSGVFTQNDLRLLTWLATPAAIAIQNARLFEQVQVGRNRLQSLSHRLVEVQETERRHIARELHDEAGQSLTSLLVDLRLLERAAGDPNEVIARVAALKSHAGDILENLHRLAIHLRPASLDHLGLVAALRQYIKTFGQQYNLTMQFEVVGLNDERLPPSVETNLYRIVQEALTNVVRHSQATRVDVLLERRGDRLMTIIEDNGIGFNPQTVGQNSRLGLLGMRERADMLEGTLVIESAAGAGTTIYVEVPYVNSHSHR